MDSEQGPQPVDAAPRCVSEASRAQEDSIQKERTSQDVIVPGIVEAPVTPHSQRLASDMPRIDISRFRTDLPSKKCKISHHPDDQHNGPSIKARRMALMPDRRFPNVFSDAYGATKIADTMFVIEAYNIDHPWVLEPGGGTERTATVNGQANHQGRRSRAPKRHPASHQKHTKANRATHRQREGQAFYPAEAIFQEERMRRAFRKETYRRRDALIERRNNAHGTRSPPFQPNAAYLRLKMPRSGTPTQSTEFHEMSQKLEENAFDITDNHKHDDPMIADETLKRRANENESGVTRI